ncbi:MAG: hypothetical protein IH628_15395 [Proteobacteria bacterium]|nr:hypothetical protein [Pseudomonadota bacterium]
METYVKTGLAIICLVILAACGGGGDSVSLPTTSAEGLWSGSTASDQTLTGFILDDGTYYILYSPQGNSALVAGYIQGNGTSSDGGFTSGNARDFNFQGFGVLPATVSGSYTEKQAFTGSVTYGSSNVVTFSTSYNMNYEAVPLLSALSGTFSGQSATSAGAVNTAFGISANGVVSGTSTNGCTVTGTATPRTHGNIFDLSLTFGATPCSMPNQTLTGMAYYSVSTRRLLAATQNGTRTEGFLFVGSKLMD